MIDSVVLDAIKHVCEMAETRCQEDEDALLMVENFLKDNGAI